MKVIIEKVRNGYIVSDDEPVEEGYLKEKFVFEEQEEKAGEIKALYNLFYYLLDKFDTSPLLYRINILLETRVDEDDWIEVDYDTLKRIDED